MKKTYIRLAALVAALGALALSGGALTRGH
jgi:hypothetical protein